MKHHRSLRSFRAVLARNILRTCCQFLLLIAFVVGVTASEQKSMVIHNPLSTDGLIVLDSSSPKFLQEVETILSHDALNKASEFLPYSMLVVNGTDRYIWGFTVVYTYPGWIAPTGKPWKHRISPSAGGPSDVQLMLGPGDIFLITPVSNFLACRDASGARKLQPVLDESLDQAIAHFQSHNIEYVEAQIDSVIFEDGTLVGPDQEEMMFKVNERIRAERDLIDSVANLRGESLRAKLLFHSKQTKKNEYGMRLGAVAHVLIQMMNTNGEGAVIEAVERMSKKKWFAQADNVRRTGK